MSQLFIITETSVLNDPNKPLRFQKTFVFDGQNDEFKAKVKEILAKCHQLAKDPFMGGYYVDFNVMPQWPILDEADECEVDNLKVSLPFSIITIKAKSKQNKHRIAAYNVTLTATDLKS